MRDYTFTVTYLGTKGTIFKEYIWRRVAQFASYNSKIGTEMQVELWWESRETRSYELPTLCIAKGPNTGGQVKGHRDRAGTKISQALGLWGCKSPAIHTPPRGDSSSWFCVTVNKWLYRTRDINISCGKPGVEPTRKPGVTACEWEYWRSQAVLEQPTVKGPQYQQQKSHSGSVIARDSCEWPEREVSLTAVILLSVNQL